MKYCFPDRGFLQIMNLKVFYIVYLVVFDELMFAVKIKDIFTDLD